MKFVTTASFTKFLIVMATMLMITAEICGQSSCLTNEEAKAAVNLLNAPAQNVAENKTLRRELLNMQEARQKIEQKISENFAENQKLIPSLNELGEKNLLRVCEIVKQNGWVKKESVGEDGYAAFMSLIRANQAFKFQREVFPVVVAAADKGYVSKPQLAALIDSIRIGSGLPQIFGTQTRIREEKIYLLPMLNEAKVDEWRKLYNLPPLSSFIKYIQSQYQMVVLKSPRLTTSPKATENKAETPQKNTAAANQILNLNEDEVIEKVESNLVNLNVRISAADVTSIANLQKSDFIVYEDDKPQEIEFFSTADAPFDLVLVLDLSGSTENKKDLIQKSTQRFIEAARPSDRIAIVTFTSEPEMISDLTQNRAQLLQSIKNIRGGGGSGVWGAIQFSLEKIIKPKSEGRRSAILIMTDGVDTSLLPGGGFLPPSYPTFIDLLESLRRMDTTIIPIYLDTERNGDSVERKAYRTARQSLNMISEETGGQMYYAKKVEDLNGVYEKVISDLSKVYSLGYQPKDENDDGAWRKITVKIPNHPNLTVRTKPGYYAK